MLLRRRNDEAKRSTSAAAARTPAQITFNDSKAVFQYYAEQPLNPMSQVNVKRKLNEKEKYQHIIG